MRVAASLGRETEQIGPFLATFSEHTDLIYLNYAIPTDNSQPSADEVNALIAAYEGRSRTPRLEYLPNLAPAVELVLVEAGFTVEGRLPVMIYDFESAAKPSANQNIELIRATTDADFLATLTVQHEAYGMDEAPTHDDVARLRKSVADGAIVIYARDIETGEPAGAGMCVAPFEGVSEVAGIGVHSAFRRRGIAASVTARLAQEAKAVGISTIFLTPGGDEAERVYSRVGFRTISRMLHISFSMKLHNPSCSLPHETREGIGDNHCIDFEQKTLW